MNNLIHRVLSYFRYWFAARNAHGLHSPFVFRLYTEVIATDAWFYAFEDLENERQILLADSHEITQVDFGASGGGALRKTTISALARTSLLPTHYAHMLFRLVNMLQPTHMLELGTSLGLTTSYLSLSNLSAQLTSFEGAPELAKMAVGLLNRKGAVNTKVVVGNIDQTLPQYLKESPKIDFVLIDANHTYEATVQYVQWLLPALSNGACLILDDIYWSPGMTKAWNELRAMPEFNATIDLYRMGWLFYKREQRKEHFILRS